MPALFRHPQSPTLGVRSLDADVSLSPDGDLLLTYRLVGDPRQLRLPQPITPERRDGLWRHCCFEAFVANVDDAAYREFNFSPAGHWQAYAFSAYRLGGLLEPASPPHITTHIDATGLSADVRLPAANLPPGPRLRLGLTAVIEASDGRLAYWALRHTAEKADFHRADSFALALALTGPHP